MGRRRLVESGEPAPYFTARNSSSASYTFSSAAGRYLVLCFYGSAADPHAAAALQAVLGRTDLFDDRFAAFFGVSNDPEDERLARVRTRVPGYRHFWDSENAIARAYGAMPDGNGQPLTRAWVILDPTLRVIATIPFRPGREDMAEALDLLAAQPPPGQFAGMEIMAPVLILPRVFEPDLCDDLIARYHAHGGEESGFMRDLDGRTKGVMDGAIKRRKDHTITDPAMALTLQHRLRDRVFPEILKVHQFRVTRMERYLVACYAAEDGGHFAPHRDNTTHATAHRRFAVSVNLNDDFQGGEVSFPEYGPRSFKVPKGGAVVFSCALLHQVSRVTEGARFAFLPFLYDDAAAELRERNRQFHEAPAQATGAVIGNGAPTGGGAGKVG